MKSQAGTRSFSLTRIVLMMLLFLAFATEGFSSHYMGGEIRWECLPNGNYRFIVRLYRECAGIEYSEMLDLTHNIPAACVPTAANMFIRLHLYPNATLGRTDLSPVCNSNPMYPHISCGTTVVPNTGGVEEWYYTSDQEFPDGVMITGVPPSTGYFFNVNVCNRNNCQNIVSASALCANLRAVMYPYQNLPVNPCWDNSPVFAERPQVIVPTSTPISYNPTAYDIENDSITYDWAPPLDELNQPITNYYLPFSYTNPLPDPTLNPNNVAAVLDHFSGQLTFTSFIQGAYVTKYKVTEYREGQVIAEIEREMQVVLLQSDSNDAPQTSLPFPGNPDPYVDSVYFGTQVSFPFSVTDTGLSNNGINHQILSLDISGGMMGTNDTSACGCPSPPCAYLSAPTPITDSLGITTNFTWQTSLNHLIFGGLLNPCVDYYFVFKASDDFCPIPGTTMRPIKIVVRDYVFNAPHINDYTLNPQNGNVSLHWVPVSNDTTHSFRYYLVYYKNSLNAEFQVIDTLYEAYQDNYTHTTVNGLTSFFWYMIKTVSGHSHAFVSAPSNEVTNFFIGIPEDHSGDMSMMYDAASGQVRVYGIPAGCSELKMDIYNTLGQLVSSHTTFLGSETVAQFPVDLRTGIYVYAVNTCKQLYRGKIKIDKDR